MSHGADLIGLVGSVISTVLWWPQARTTWAARHDASALIGLSLGTLSLLVLNALVWGIYAIWTGAWFSGVPGLINLPLALWMFVIVLRARRHECPGLPD